MKMFLPVVRSIKLPGLARLSVSALRFLHVQGVLASGLFPRSTPVGKKAENEVSNPNEEISLRFDLPASAR